MFRQRLAVLLVVVVAAVLIAAPASAAPRPVAAKAGARPPVVMIVFDEFPVDTLRGPDGKIDPVRYPNFAALAAASTWFVNAHTIYDSTPKALPAIMDARRPRVGPPATAAGHPSSVFTFFGDRGYRVVASEESTAVCPWRFCHHSTRERPAILHNLNGGRPQRLERWIDSIGVTKQPTFFFKDVLLPHGPWIYLPSGKQLRRDVHDPVPGLNSPAGFGDRGLTLHNEQRYLLQVAFLDRELGKLLARLRRTGLYDKAMIVATADHGFAFQVGVKDRRKVTSSNVDQIAPVPLFIKTPNQHRGRVDRAYAQTIDVVPTMADLLHARLRWKVDGRSAFSAVVRRRRLVRLPTRDFTGVVEIGARAIEARRRANIRRLGQLFGTGAQSLALFGSPMAQIYRVGPHSGLIGRSLTGLGVSRPAHIRAIVADAGLRRNVQASSTVLPTQVAGSITGGGRRETRAIAVAINGRIQAVGRSFYLQGSRTETFSVLVPEDSLDTGRNLTEILAVDRTGRRLTLIGSA